MQAISRVGPFAGVLLLSPRIAAAGMPMITLSDFARMRIQTISFFLVAILVSAWVVRRLWNSLADDFERIPRLSYSKSVRFVLLWGLLFVIVLTMISGARELMTPGAWAKQGLTYTLDDNSRESSDEPANTTVDDEDNDETLLSNSREYQLESLRSVLWRFADAHDGVFPPPPDAEATDSEQWQVPNRFNTRYIYFAGKTTKDGESILACEPEVFGDVRYLLLCNGDVQASDTAAIQRALATEGSR